MLVDGQVIAVVPNWLLAVGDAAAGCQRDGMEGKLVVVDHLLQATLKGLGQRIEMRVSGGGEDLRQGHPSGRHGQWVSIEGPDLDHLVGVDRAHHIRASADGPEGTPPPRALASAIRSGVTPNRAL